MQRFISILLVIVLGSLPLSSPGQDQTEQGTAVTTEVQDQNSQDDTAQNGNDQNHASQDDELDHSVDSDIADCISVCGQAVMLASMVTILVRCGCFDDIA